MMFLLAMNILIDFGKNNRQKLPEAVAGDVL